MPYANALNSQYVQFISPTINFKTVALTTIFTPFYDLVVTNFTEYCSLSTGANQDSVWSIGWTAATYEDFITSGSEVFNTMQGTYKSNSSTFQVLLFPAGTPIRINVTSAETGTALQGKFFFNGFYFT